MATTADTTATVYPLPDPIRKTCALFRLLAGHELLGLAPAEIAKGLNVSASWVSKTMPALASETGFVERLDGANRWRLGVPFVRIANTVNNELATAKKRMTEVSERYQVPL